MSKRESNQRQQLIIRRLQRGATTFAEIQAHLKRHSEQTGYHLTTSNRTFKRDCEEIAHHYNYDIQYDFPARVWRLTEREGAPGSDRMLEAMEMQYALQLAEGLTRQVYFEPRKPAGTEHFYGLLHAIQNRFLVTFRYHKFWEADFTTRRVRPLALKEFRSRWYLLAREEHTDILKTFGLDRMDELEVLKKKFAEQARLDVAALYHDAFGILNDEEVAPQDVVLWFEPVQGGYVRTYPLHHSQQIVSEDAKGLTVRLHVRPEHDFVMELLSFGPQVKVLKPAALVRRVQHEHQQALAQYEKKNPG